jgi:hypothetical protein
MKRERRRQIRYHLEFPVTVVTSTGTIMGETKNFSRAGAFICCPQPLKPKEGMALSIKFPDGFFMEVSSQVVWTRFAGPEDTKRAGGMGVRFLWEK